MSLLELGSFTANMPHDPILFSEVGKRGALSEAGTRSHKAKTDRKLSSLTMLPYVANRSSLRTGTSFGAHSHRKGNKQGIMHDCMPVQRLYLLVHGRSGSEVVKVI